MSDHDDHEFFKLRKDGKTYLSKVFQWSGQTAERIRHVRMVFEGSDEQHLGEIEGALCLRLTGETRKTQVTALVSQDANEIKRLTLQTFKARPGFTQSFVKEEFTFRGDEFERLLGFLNQIKFVDLTNEENFQIEDISKKAGPKAVIDASDRGIIDAIQGLSGNQRAGLLRNLQGSLTSDEINTLLGRKEGLAEFEQQLSSGNWSEASWQDFFEREQWVFGYGLDYRIMRHFDREMVVGGAGTDNQNKPTVDFLTTFTDYTVLVEIKKPATPIFKRRAGGRAGTWDFSSEFMSAVSQILEQKAEWLAFSQQGDHYNKDGTERLEARTRSPKAILVIGSRAEFDPVHGVRDARVKQDTFELFRRETRSIDIITFDELVDRARFITKNTR
uniref:Shedu protein SduA C-terminal domain-containing protein n=1 Tax=Caulobacter sp. (strain K31) TaxID=366602 RepID=B0SW48_CAUSK